MSQLLISVENPKNNKYNVKVQEAFNYRYLVDDFRFNLDKVDAYRYVDELRAKYANQYECYLCTFKY